MTPWFKICAACVAVSLLAVGSAGCGQSGEGERADGWLTVSAAVSLTEALREIGKAYEAQSNGSVRIRYNFAGSGTLERQIAQGAPVDVFVSAAARHVDALAAQDLVVNRAYLVSARLAVIVPEGGGPAIRELADLTGSGVRRIAIGVPGSVPAGAYARQALMHAGLWRPLEDKLVQAANVRQVLQTVRSGNAEAGFVYDTDARVADGTAVAFTVDPQSHEPIRYEGALLKEAGNAAAAARFYRYLQSDEALRVLRAHGFTAAIE